MDEIAPEVRHTEWLDDIKMTAMPLAKGGTWAEFGVFCGNSARHLIHGMPDGTEIHLFDSFKGLPEYWDMIGDGTYPKKTLFAIEDHEIPVFNDIRVTIHKGLFADTLPIADMGVLQLVNIDCDLYSSTKTVLDHIEVESGTIIIFDEYHGYPTYKEHERKACQEWLERTGIELEWLGHGRMGALGRVL
jgi:hypothetical protein